MISLEEGKYEEALEAFTALGSYQDSEERVAQCKYELGKIAFTEQDWDTAIDFLDENTYADSGEYLEKAKTEKGMSENADYQFLEALKQSVTKRYNDSSKDSYDRQNLVNTELSFLNKFRNAEFFDGKIKQMARLYLEGLDKQKASFKIERRFMALEEWSAGMVDRYTALNYLYKHYDFMSDDPDFISGYIADYERVTKERKAFEIINADILKNVNNLDSFSYLGPNSCYTIFKNSTTYTFDVLFEFTVYNQDETQILNISEDYIERIEPGNEYKLTVNYGNNTGNFIIYTDWEIIDVK